MATLRHLRMQGRSVKEIAKIMGVKYYTLQHVLDIKGWSNLRYASSSTLPPLTSLDDSATIL
jgi:hypothetical protein